MIGQFVKTLGSALMIACLCLPVNANSELDNPLGLGPGITPEGRWRSENGDSRYDVELCGEDGVSLCGKLIWIRYRDRNERNVQFLDTWVVDEIERAKPAEWRGTLNVYGTQYGGSVKMVSMDEMLMTGCVLILCETYSFIRLRNPDGTRVSTRQRNTDDE